ncbi:RRXRR domain-containing protein [Sulfobacillus thermosulfidooxidans]|uniref:RRXRR domain-containing protein n=1 Tax=Sulfobacillus thermosulfidooxidans TaxID=28034 RepID=UPI0006B68E6D|nr:RRXRR domain-containing protein [Sulfobacillus thermosulfidooxidans]
MAVFVFGNHYKPLMSCSEKRASMLREHDRTYVFKLSPFTIRLVDRDQDNSVLQPLRLKLDPNAKSTGKAITLKGDLPVSYRHYRVFQRENEWQYCQQSIT